MCPRYCVLRAIPIPNSGWGEGCKETSYRHGSFFCPGLSSASFPSIAVITLCVYPFLERQQGHARFFSFKQNTSTTSPVNVSNFFFRLTVPSQLFYLTESVLSRVFNFCFLIFVTSSDVVEVCPDPTIVLIWLLHPQQLTSWLNQLPRGAWGGC